MNSTDTPRSLSLFPAKAPGPTGGDGNERDTSGPSGGKVAGKSVIRWTGVASPRIEIHLPPAPKRTGTGVVVCPGGGFHILAKDLEGTEVASWLNGLGVAAFVLNYRVPTAGQPDPALGPAIDAQRALRTVRQNASSWGLRPDRIGILGFSAGGKTAAVAASRAGKPLYDDIDNIDRQTCKADFAILIYPAYLTDERGNVVPETSAHREFPPTFLAHAADDPVPARNSISLFQALQGHSVASELHVWETGGHGYGLRRQDSQPVTTWPDRATDWMRRRGLLARG
jgi:acetyl esterase/lipase